MKILIVGSSSGIGNHLARILVHKGHEVWGIARKNHQIEGAITQKCDATQIEQLQALHDDIRNRWGQLDALICTAAINGELGPAMTAAPEAWIHSVEFNLKATYYPIRIFFDLLNSLPHSPHNPAKIICFSGGGATGPRENFSAYGCAKTAIVRLVETLSHEWAGQSIDINAIAPGVVGTPLQKEILEAGATRAGEKEIKQATRSFETIAEDMEQITQLIEFMLSPESNFLSGKLISARWDNYKKISGRGKSISQTEQYTLRRLS